LISDDQRPSAMGIGFEAGANFFLYKPFDKERLMNFCGPPRDKSSRSGGGRGVWRFGRK